MGSWEAGVASKDRIVEHSVAQEDENSLRMAKGKYKRSLVATAEQGSVIGLDGL